MIESFRASDGYEFAYRRYPATGTAKAHLVFVHGIRSHGGWYEKSCTELSNRGFEVKLSGRLEYDRKAAKWTRIDIAAAGDSWGEGTFTRNARTGRRPLGVAFELAGNAPADKVPPQFAREWNAYFGK